MVQGNYFVQGWYYKSFHPNILHDGIVFIATPTPFSQYTHNTAVNSPPGIINRTIQKVSTLTESKNL